MIPLVTVFVIAGFVALFTSDWLLVGLSVLAVAILFGLFESRGSRKMAGKTAGNVADGCADLMDSYFGTIIRTIKGK